MRPWTWPPAASAFRSGAPATRSSSRTLAPAAFAFRGTLARGRSLGDAAAAALDADPAADLAVLLREALDEEVLW